jgi:hypothetical protein
VGLFGGHAVSIDSGLEAVLVPARDERARQFHLKQLGKQQAAVQAAIGPDDAARFGAIIEHHLRRCRQVPLT